METWKDINGFEGLYQVSSSGRVKSLDRIVDNHMGGCYSIKGRIISASNNGTGYLFLNLCKNGVHHRYYIHRLVANAFIENPLNHKQINHKDEDKENNNVSNLEWCNSRYNNTYGSRLDRLSKKRGKAVLQYSLSGEFLKEFTSITRAAKESHVDTASIRKSINENSSSGEFQWRLKESDEYSSVISKQKRKTRFPVCQYDMSGKFISEYKSASEASKRTGINKNQIGRVCKGLPKYETAGGFKWKYKNQL